MQNHSFLLIWTMLLVFACQEDTQRRDDYAIEGIDVSRYQSQIDWHQIKAQGIHFAFIKATEGTTHVDSLFGRNWQATRKTGIRRGAYHFFRSQSSALLQAEHFINKVNLQEGDLPPVLDVELIGEASPADLREGVRIWLSTVEEYYDIKPIVYSSQKFYNKYLAGHFSDYPLWIARYNKEEPVLACGTNWSFWQYGNRGRLNGIEDYVDFNVFKSSWLEFEKICLPSKPILSSQ